MSISPKVSAPTILGLLVGFVLLALGERETGLTVILTALGGGAVGYAKKA